MTQKLALTATVVTIDGGKGTIVMVRFGNIPVATAKIGGKWTPEQGLSELRKNPKRFKLEGENSAIILRGQGINVPEAAPVAAAAAA